MVPIPQQPLHLQGLSQLCQQLQHARAQRWQALVRRLHPCRIDHAICDKAGKAQFAAAELTARQADRLGSSELEEAL